MEELENLVKLQETDSLILSLKQKLEIIPAEIQKFDSLSQEIDKKFEKEKNKLLELEKRKRDKEREIQDINEKIKKLKEKTSQIKTNKEYQALLKEIESVTEELKKEEENFLIILYELDEIKEKIDKIKIETEARKNEIEKKKKELEKEITDITQQIEFLKENRKGIIKKLPPELYQEYIDLMKKHKGIAVARVKNSVCQGCFLHIPPQLYVEIKLNQSIYHCPQCGRILYYRKESEKEIQVQSE